MLDNDDLIDIEELARLAMEGEGPQEEVRRYEGPGRLNYHRAYQMLWRLKLEVATHEIAVTALRENWPREWRKNEQGTRFPDKWFTALATEALQNHRRRMFG